MSKFIDPTKQSHVYRYNVYTCTVNMHCHVYRIAWSKLVGGR